MKTQGFLIFLAMASTVWAADVVPNEIKQPGTQPGEVNNLESPTRCDNCHGGYDPVVEPAHNWRGSMMAQATRDPIFWATVAVAEQDFDGAGDLCIRCHSADGWVNGRSTPTDGSALGENDATGVACDLCHKATNPDVSEWVGDQFPPFLAHNGQAGPAGFYGSGMYVLWGGSEKLGPYNDAEARHQFGQSAFHRSREFCGTCHDVSNPAVGDLAHNHGAQLPLAPGTFSGVLGSPVDEKAAFNNFPYQYGIVERTFSEYMSGLLPFTPVRDYALLPADLQAGAIQRAYEAALTTGNGGDYADNSTRYFTCQTCHMPPVTGAGCDKNGAPIRTDLPLHDMTGGNYWMPDAILYLDSLGKLLIGGDLADYEQAALSDGKTRAMQMLSGAGSLTVLGDAVRVTNLTGHKLISGYPEGRRMWLNVTWYDGTQSVIREDGKYGWLTVDLDGVPTDIKTIIDLEDPNLVVYEAHYAMTQEWAAQLLDLGYSPDMPLTFDRVTGTTDHTLVDLAGSSPGDSEETFHFVLNNLVYRDNRIPPYGMSYDEARLRNALPVPEDQFGAPGPGGVYEHWHDHPLNPPAGATYASI
ncbi:MAG: hypothetical protein ACYTHJ_12570, partial [Planctomycetota bacterium]